MSKNGVKKFFKVVRPRVVKVKRYVRNVQRDPRFIKIGKYGRQLQRNLEYTLTN